MNKRFVALGFLLLILAFISISSYLYIRYENLNADYNDLTGKYDDLTNKYNTLVNNYSELERTVFGMVKQIPRP